MAELIDRQDAINAVMEVCKECNPYYCSDCVGCEIDKALAKIESVKVWKCEVLESHETDD